MSLSQTTGQPLDAYDLELHNNGGRPRLYIRSDNHSTHTVDFLFSTTIYGILTGTDANATNAGTPIDCPLTISIAIDEAARQSGANARATLYIYDVSGNLLKTETKEVARPLPTAEEYQPTDLIYMIGGDHRSNTA